ncbi:MAG: polysaccharide deacetylase family protein [Lentisphaerae bacterium]|nr:polysaccharide deacetylase family protein [Lentisphaerota bacterium]
MPNARILPPARLLLWLLLGGLAGALSACRPPQSAGPSSAAPGEIIYFVPVTSAVAALTFDDGPNGAATEQILDLLQHYRVPAAFFLIGTNVLHYPALAQRIAREGHLIGNHSFVHPRFDQMSTAAMAQEIAAGTEAIASVTGIRPAWLRPPYGINGPGLREVCRAQGLTIAGWSLDASDWNPHSAQEIAEHVLSGLTPGDILLLHDGCETQPDANRQSTVEAVALILERLSQAGCRFVSLPELLRRQGPPLAEFANGVRLLGLQLSAQPVSGATLGVRYFWDLPADWSRADPSMAFVHFVGQHARLQDDHRLPSSQDVRDLALASRPRRLPLPATAAPGRYQIRIGLFDPARPQVKRRIPIRYAPQQHQRAVVLPVELELSAPHNDQAGWCRSAGPWS